MRAGTAARCVTKPVAFGNPHHAGANTDANHVHLVPGHDGARNDNDQHHGELSPIWGYFLRGKRGADPHAGFQSRRHTDHDTRDNAVGNTKQHRSDR